MTDSDSIGILAYDGVDARSLVSVHDFTVRADRAGCEVGVTVFSLVPTQRVTASTGIGIEPDDVLIGTPDVVVVPGGKTSGDESAPSYPQEVPDRVAQLADAGATPVGIGSGVLALGEAGLLTERRATTDPTFRDELETHATSVVGDPVVESDGVFTATGPTASLTVTQRVLEQRCDGAVLSRVTTTVGAD